MSVTMKLKRIEGNNFDLSEWGFGSSEIDKAITKEFQKRMDVFFSETGIEVAFGITLSRKTPDVLVLWGEIIDSGDGLAYGKGETSLMDLFTYLDDTDVVADALRKMADGIEQRGREE